MLYAFFMWTVCIYLLWTRKGDHRHQQDEGAREGSGVNTNKVHDVAWARRCHSETSLYCNLHPPPAMGSYWSLGEGRDIFFRGMTTAKLPMFLWVTLLNSVAHKTNKQQQLKDMKAEWEAAEEKGTKEDHRGWRWSKYVIYYKNVTMKLFIAYICY